MKKRLVLLLTIVILINSTIPILAVEDINNENYTYAIRLKQLGVFVGTSNGFELDRAPTRIEGLVMLIRLLGKEEHALSSDYPSSPFEDVPTWAVAYVNYAFHEGLTEGISSTEFGSNQTLTANHYATFLLRSLQYDDSHGDFKWNEAISFANSIDLLDASSIDQDFFTRGDVARLSYNTLKHPLKTQVQTLAEYLIELGAIEYSLAIAIDLINHPASIGARVYPLKDESFYTLGESSGVIDVVASASIKSKEQKDVLRHQMYKDVDSTSVFTLPVAGYKKLAFRITNQYADSSVDKVYIKKGKATTLEEAKNLPTLISYPINDLSILISVTIENTDTTDLTLYIDTHTDSITYLFSMYLLQY